MYHIRFNARLNTIKVWFELDYDFTMWEVETLGL